MKSKISKAEINEKNTFNNDNRTNEMYQRKNNVFLDNYKLIFIITIIFPIIIYFFQINIFYHIEYGDVDDFFKILSNTFKVVIPGLILMGISAFIRKNSSESIFETMSLLMISCFIISVFIGTCLKDSSQLIGVNDYADKNSYNDNKYTDYNYDYDYSGTYTESYSNYHKCEYAGCTNYASGTKYCSKHNKTKCIKSGCNKIEAYPGAGYCQEHQLEQILNY